MNKIVGDLLDSKITPEEALEKLDLYSNEEAHYYYDILLQLELNEKNLKKYLIYFYSMNKDNLLLALETITKIQYATNLLKIKKSYVDEYSKIMLQLYEKTPFNTSEDYINLMYNASFFVNIFHANDELEFENENYYFESLLFLKRDKISHKNMTNQEVLDECFTGYKIIF